MSGSVDAPSAEYGGVRRCQVDRLSGYCLSDDHADFINRLGTGTRAVPAFKCCHAATRLKRATDFIESGVDRLLAPLRREDAGRQDRESEHGSYNDKRYQDYGRFQASYPTLGLSYAPSRLKHPFRPICSNRVNSWSPKAVSIIACRSHTHLTRLPHQIFGTAGDKFFRLRYSYR